MEPCTASTPKMALVCPAQTTLVMLAANASTVRQTVATKTSVSEMRAIPIPMGTMACSARTATLMQGLWHDHVVKAVCRLAQPTRPGSTVSHRRQRQTTRVDAGVRGDELLGTIPTRLGYGRLRGSHLRLP